jgi:hypothetical protein
VSPRYDIWQHAFCIAHITQLQATNTTNMMDCNTHYYVPRKLVSFNTLSHIAGNCARCRRLFFAQTHWPFGLISSFCSRIARARENWMTRFALIPEDNHCRSLVLSSRQGLNGSLETSRKSAMLSGEKGGLP